MHAKAFSFDRQIGFVGSFDLDPRSNRLNTERDLDRNTDRVEPVGNRLEWVTREGDERVRFDSEPEAGLWKRIQVRVLSWLPIEGLL